MGNSPSKDPTKDTPSQEGSPDKPNLYQRYQTAKRGNPISEADIQKYTGKSRNELTQWAENEPGVGKNQRAGGIAQGPASGLGGVAAADGYGGWGFGAEPNDGSRGLKFPPKQPTKA